MPLVNYSDSDHTDSSEHRAKEDAKDRGTKRKRTHKTESFLPPLPDTFHDLYASTTRLSNQDDPTLHAGRQRVTPHVEGNWPTHLYIEWHPSTEQSNRLHEHLTSISKTAGPSKVQIHSLLKSDLGAELPLHISLSRPITLLTHQREPFVDALLNSINKSNLSPFHISPLSVDWVANDEKTRWFLVMKLAKPARDELNVLLSISNQIAQSFGQPPLYARPQPSNDSEHPKRRKGQSSSSQRLSTHKSPLTPSPSSDTDLSSSFHVSLAWTLHPPSQAMIDRLQHSDHEMQDMKIEVHSVKAKIGNNVTSVPLTSKVDSSNGILERS